MTGLQFLTRPDGTRLAYRHRPGTGPTIVFLPGYMSDMEGSKTLAVDAWAEANGRAMLRLDYSGCGASGGRFEDGTLTIWRDDVLALVDAVTEGPLLLVGSSMGGWLMLLAALARPERIAGLVGIAAAPDFTRWGGSDIRTTAGFRRSGDVNLLLEGEIALDCPVRLLHGQADPDVPWDISIQLAARLRSAEVQTLLVKEGDHRLSRPQDIALLLGVIAALVEKP